MNGDVEKEERFVEMCTRTQGHENTKTRKNMSGRSFFPFFLFFLDDGWGVSDTKLGRIVVLRFCLLFLFLFDHLSRRNLRILPWFLFLMVARTPNCPRGFQGASTSSEMYNIINVSTLGSLAIVPE